MVKKLLVYFMLFTVFISLGNTYLYAEELSSQQKGDLEKKIQEYQKKLEELRSQKSTLASQIQYMDTQIYLTGLKVEETEKTIETKEKEVNIIDSRINGLDSSLNHLSKTMLERVALSYKNRSTSTFSLILDSGNANDFMNKYKYYKTAEDNNKKVLLQVQETKLNFEEQKKLREKKLKDLEALRISLASQQQEIVKQQEAKKRFLQVTQNDEGTYQKLLTQAKQQLEGFKSFATSQVGSGASILPAQSSPDGWYYNQRDERWGRNTIGSSSENVWEVGCLLTSVAMVMKKHGHNVTPNDIANNNSYFLTNSAYMLIPWGGGSVTSAWGNDQTTIDNKLAAGEPVIVGVRAGPFGMHFVVLKSGSGGNYIMNDPWNGADLKFTDYYSTGQIFQYGYYR